MQRRQRRSRTKELLFFLTRPCLAASETPNPPPCTCARLTLHTCARHTPQREHDNYARGEGGQGAQTKQMRAGWTGVRECTGSRAGHARMESKMLTCGIGASQRRIPWKSNRHPPKRTPTHAAQMQQMSYERAGTTASLPGTVTHMPCLSAVVRAQALACANGCYAG